MYPKITKHLKNLAIVFFLVGMLCMLRFIWGPFDPFVIPSLFEKSDVWIQRAFPCFLFSFLSLFALEVLTIIDDRLNNTEAIQDKNAERIFFDRVARDGLYGTFMEPNSEDKESIDALKLSEVTGLVIGELGCGTGKFGRYLAKNGNRVIGIDISTGMLELNSKFGKNLASYRCFEGDIEDKRLFKENVFDAVLCPYILHHLPDMTKAFENISFWLKDGGVVFIMEPNGSNPVNALSKLLARLVLPIFPGLNKDGQCASVNEPRDPTFYEYRRFLQEYDFEIELAKSVSVPKYTYLGITMLSIIGVIKVVMYGVNYFLNPSDIKKRFNLVIKARKSY